MVVVVVGLGTVGRRGVGRSDRSKRNEVINEAGVARIGIRTRVVG